MLVLGLKLKTDTASMMALAAQAEEGKDVVGLEEQLAYLKEYDGEWLERILQERCKELGYGGKTGSQGGVGGTDQLPPEFTAHGSPRAALRSDTSLAGPYDVTAPTLPPGLVVTEHVELLRSHPWETTELGPMSEWSPELRRMVNFTLQDRKSAVLWWGPMRRCK